MTATLLAEVLLVPEDEAAAQAVFAPGPVDGAAGEAEDVWE
jgi:hypothetical protein